MKNYYILLLLLCPQLANAIPLPQMATAAISIGELLLIVFSTLAIYLPFMRVIKGRSLIIYIILFFSILLNFYLVIPTENKTKEVREGMIWSEEERQKDINSIKEEEAFEILNKKNDNYYFADVRTGAEKELGTAEGFNKVNWKELAQNKEKFKNKTVIATCWTGMRGSEICSKLRAIGINCKYLQGGLKRWKELGYKISYTGDQSIFGSIPYYTNSEKYLTPEETKEHIKNKALIIDARNEKEFNTNHIKSAINIPFIDLTPEEINYKIQTLPVSNQGVIVSCFGIVSCSEASSFGWELNKLGFTYLGAYGGGQELLLEKINYFSLITQNIEKNFNYLNKKYPLIFNITLTSLFILLWIGIKKFTIESFNNKSKINRNLFTLNSLILTFIYYTLVYSIANIYNFTNENLNYILILLSSIILTYELYKKINLNNLLINVFTCLILIIVFSIIPTKINIIFASMITITFSLNVFINLIKNIRIKILKEKKFLSLKNAISIIGNNGKAGKLSFFINKRYNIPDGYIINSKNFNKINNKDIHFIKNKLGEEIAIRSTAYDEDSLQNSKAGMNVSFVPINTENMIEKIKQVYLSYKNNKDDYVLLQKIVKPVLAGVAFSKNPELAGTILIEYCEGFSEELMSGKKEAYKLLINKRNKEVLFKSNDKINTVQQQLINICLKLEKELEYPVDIEWAFDGKELWILQVRYQTALDNLYSNSIEYDKDKLSELEYLNLEKNEMSVVLEGISRLNASIINEIWKDENIAELAAKMSYCKWNKKHKQNYYQYAFNYLWASNYPLITPPKKILNYVSQKLFNINFKNMEKEKKDILKKFEIYKAIDFKKIDNLTLLNLFHETLNDWKLLEKQALYIYFMANNAMINSNNYIQEMKINTFNKEEYAYFSMKEYLLTEKRNIENTEKLKENLYLKYSKEFSKNFSNSEKNKILFTRNLLVLREISKYDALKLFYIIRKVLIALKENLNLGEEFWELEVNEIDKIFNKETKEQILRRKYDIKIKIPDALDDDNIIYLNSKNEYEKKKEFFVSNPQSFKGSITHIKELNDNIDNILKEIKNEIIYVEYMTPELILSASKYGIKYICAKYGSYLSHPSVLAREFNITCYIGLDLSNKNYIDINNT